MRPNNVLESWKAGKAIVNGWLAIPSSFSAELMAHQDWDAITIDTQHGLIDYTDAVHMLQAISTTEKTPLARVPWNDPAAIMKLLDAGCYGIIAPMINSRAECEAFVGACKYPPVGYRSNGPIRAVIYAGSDYQVNANDTTLAIAMIETDKAVDNLDEILSTPGLDGIYIGPADLALSYGREPRLDPNDQFVYDKMMDILAGAKKQNIPAGLHCGTAEFALEMIEKGFLLTTIANDARMMAIGCQQELGKMKGSVKKETGSPY
ncbi:MAG: HpcH/HpaI aldolase family protein [Alphaproteobacteria bacterium]|jgi:4-hydroxy-2-oxoheptanedioate aldolase